MTYYERFDVLVSIPEGERHPEEMRAIVRRALRDLAYDLRGSGRKGALVACTEAGLTERAIDEEES